MSIDVELVDGDLPALTRHISGTAVILQRVRLRLLTGKGEWILDRNVGIPYLRFIRQKPPNLNEIGAFIRREIEAVPGVLSIDTFSADHNTETRRIVFKAQISVVDEPDTIEVVVLPLGETGNSSPAVLFLGRQGPILSMGTP